MRNGNKMGIEPTELLTKGGYLKRLTLLVHVKEYYEFRKGIDVRKFKSYDTNNNGQRRIEE